MGAVYSAVQENLQRRVAVKVLLGELSSDHVMRFRQEALASAALGHPNIVQVTDFQAPAGEPPFLVMELLEGESLRAFMGRHVRVTPERTVFIAVQILAALSAAHKAGIIHRDIKPANIFLSRTPAANDFVKILDFGIAKVVRQEAGQGPRTEMGAVLGTPAYMAPEQALGLDIDHRTDLYALGACMYEMLTGRKPLVAATSGELLVAIARQVPEPVARLAPKVDARLAALIDSSLAKDPRLRPHDALDMIDALSPWARSAVSRAKRRPGERSGELVDGDYVPETAKVPPTIGAPEAALAVTTGTGTATMAPINAPTTVTMAASPSYPPRAGAATQPLVPPAAPSGSSLAPVNTPGPVPVPVPAPSGGLYPSHPPQAPSTTSRPHGRATPPMPSTVARAKRASSFVLVIAVVAMIVIVLGGIVVFILDRLSPR
ncbi:MAG: Serine/threonine protein kinase [Labilithrix sp.]|nr:Serine/threonine protein kinase [Labilithrix sp.]